MRNNEFTSATDRRWQRRYETIVQRKDMNQEYDRQRKLRKSERKLIYKNDVQLDFSKLEGLYMPAVLCTTKDKANNLFREVRKRDISVSLSYGGIWPYEADTVYVFIGDSPKWDCVVETNISIAQKAYCKIIPYEDLLPPPDYGEICCMPELSMLFGG